MTVEDLAARFEYCYWSNAILADALSRLSEEEFTRTIAGSYGSVRNTMVHMLSAEWGWLARCGGRERGPALVPGDYPTVGALLDQGRQVEVHMRAFLACLTDDDLHRPVEFTLGGSDPQTRTVGELLEHAANHGVHHRGQVALLLRMLGVTPGNFDLLIYQAR